MSVVLPKPFCFLDRDGVINKDTGYLHKIEDWQWKPGALEGLAILSEHYTLVVVSNQSGIGRGMYTEEDYGKLTRYMKALLLNSGIRAATYHCPHAPGVPCECRKPGIGMFLEAEQDLGPVDWRRSWVIGDKLSDIQAGFALDMNAVLIHSRYWKEGAEADQADRRLHTLLEAAYILRNYIQIS